MSTQSNPVAVPTAWITSLVMSINIDRLKAAASHTASDAAGSANILSRFLYSELGRISPPAVIKYRHPFDATGKRSPVDTGQVAWAYTSQEAAGLLPQQSVTINTRLR
jgi:hypothetical protein